jgi:tetratricopeptide (TPR) repeat protein
MSFVHVCVPATPLTTKTIMLLPIFSAISVLGAIPTGYVTPASHHLPLPTSLVAQSSSPSPSSSPSSSIATLLPETTVGVILVDTNEAKWEALSRFGLFPKDFSFPSALYPTQSKVNFYTDVRPWLGNQIGYAFLPASKTQNHSIVIASVKDQAPISRFLEHVKASRVKPSKEHQYKGVTILEWEPESPLGQVKDTPVKDTPVEDSQAPDQKPPKSGESPFSKELGIFAPKGLAIALLPGYVVSSDSAEAIQQLIDAQAVGKPLSNVPAFQRTTARSQYAKALMVGYGDYAKVYASALAYDREQFKKIAPNTPFPNLPDAPSSGGFYDAIDGYVWADPDGLHIQTSSNFREPRSALATAFLTNPNQILGQLPATNYAVANSRGLAFIWKLFSIAFESQPTLKPKIDQFRQFSQTFIGLDDRDIFPWMDGEFTTFAYPTRQGFLPSTVPNLDLGFGMMIQTSDRKAAESALNKLDRVAQQRFGKTFVSTQPSFTSWNTTVQGKPQNVFTHGWVKPDTLVLLGGGGALSEFDLKSNQTLLQSPNFQAAIAPLSKENLGYFYINGGALMTLVNNSVLPLFFGASPTASTPYFDLNDLKATLGSIRSISGTSTLTSEKFQSEGFMALATTRPAPVTASELIELGQKKLDRLDSEGAIENFSRALSLEPQNDQIYLKRADALQAKSDIEGAIADYTQAIQLNPNNADAYRRRAEAQGAQSKYQAALADLDRAIQLNPDASEAYSARADFRGIVEDYKGAIADADQAIRQNDSDSDAYNIRCYARARGFGDFKAALPDCERAIELDAESPANYSSRCYVRAGLKDKTALEDCDRAFKTDPDYAYNYEDRGLAKLALGNPKGALEDLQKALEFSKTQGDAVAQKRITTAIERIRN